MGHLGQPDSYYISQRRPIPRVRAQSRCNESQLITLCLCLLDLASLDTQEGVEADQLGLG